MLPSGSSYLFAKKNVFLGALALALTGCGMGTTSSSPTELPLGTIGGIVHGGANPIVGGRVRLWETTTGAGGATYGSVATELTAGQTVTTGSTGYFSITAGYTCTSGQFAYITVTGGNSGGKGVNKNSVQMAALGSCSNLSTTAKQNATSVYISEVSTVAAAYALSNFITDSEGFNTSPDGNQLIYVNAPATNNDPTGTCTNSGTTISTCTGAGLAHAFANAANLANVVMYNGDTPTGIGNYALDGYRTAGTNSAAIVPQALINTLGNMMSACVNSSGGMATTGSSTFYTTANTGNCKTLFGTTTIGAATPPSDTLQAMVNLAKQPQGYGLSGTSITSLFKLQTGYGAFGPALTAAPGDFSMAITYTGINVPTAGTTTTFTTPVSEALDAAGNVYIDDQLTTGGVVYGISNSGTGLFSVSDATITDPKQIATDSLGHLWVNNDDSGTNIAIRCFTSSGSTCTNAVGTTYDWSLAVDKSNTLWVGRSASGSTYYQIRKFAPPSYADSPISQYFNANIYAIAVDQGQNIWAAGYSSSSSTAGTYIYVPRTSSTAFGTAVQTSLPNHGSTITYDTQGIAIDSTQSAFFQSKSAFNYITPTVDSNKYITAISTATGVSDTGAYPTWNQVDGAGINWYGSSNGIYSVNSTAQYFSIKPCLLTSFGATTCVASTDGSYYSNYNQVIIDDAGTIWALDSGTSGAYGRLVEVIGTAAPVWSQLSYGNPGVKP